MEGYELEFEEIPFQENFPRPYNQSAEQSEILNSQISDLLAKGVVETIPIYDVKFLSGVFLRPKQNGKHRMIIDLSNLNEFIEKIHFKMDHLNSALEMVYTHCFFTSVDLQDAYYSVPIAPHHQSYLSFVWDEIYYRFTVLPFGLSSAPRVFTKLLKPVLSTLREDNIDCLGYIDDFLIVSPTAEDASSDVAKMQETLRELGFTINVEKSSLIPNNEIVFLGYIINSIEMTVRPTDKKVQKCRDKIDFLLQNHWVEIRKVAEVLGILVDLCKGVEYGKSHYRALEKDKVFSLRRAGRAGYDGVMTISNKAKKELRWWSQNVDKKPKKIRSSVPSQTLVTDASEEGWGAVFEGSATGGRWSKLEQNDHINVLEIRAILFGLQSFCRDDTNSEILIKSDNTTAISYVNKMGGMVSSECNEISSQIWDFCEKRNIWVLATHIPGVLNVVADYESRHFSDDTEWALSDSIFDDVCSCFGAPSIDLFASRNNYKLNKYVSWKPDPSAWAVDAFTLDWSQFHLPFIFPPFRLVGRCVQKIRMEKASAIVVAPHWPGQTWFTGLMKLTNQEPLLFRRRDHNLRTDIRRLKDSPMSRIPLVVVRC